MIYPNSIWLELNGIMKKNFWGIFLEWLPKIIFRIMLNHTWGWILVWDSLGGGVGLQVMCSNSRIIFAHDFNTI